MDLNAYVLNMNIKLRRSMEFYITLPMVVFKQKSKVHDELLIPFFMELRYFMINKLKVFNIAKREALSCNIYVIQGLMDIEGRVKFLKHIICDSVDG